MGCISRALNYLHYTKVFVNICCNSHFESFLKKNMAFSTDCRISLSATSQLRGAAGLAGKNWRLVKFCNGEAIGKKLKQTKLQQSLGGVTNKNARQRVCMSLTADVASEAKVR